MRILIKGGVWKNTEDEILKAAVMKYGKNQWARVASLMNRKSAKQCKARWYEWLDPSIKKTEWTREEEEKLLHLAKLMPGQWRTIAPIVGRTAGQCMEHYERLLDQAQTEAAELSTEDPRRLRPGEIDPTPETKPARPDPIDMDDDEKEMLSEARARLANTKGKKAKRKARERMLEESRRLSMLQKRRELKAAGIESRLGLGRKRKYMDYAREIPYQKVPPVGFYDIGEENEEGKKYALDAQTYGKELSEMEGRHAKEEEDKQRKKDQKRMKDLFKNNAPEALLKMSEEADSSALRRRLPLELPAPQITENELEEIVKLGKTSSMGPPTSGFSATQGLVGDYSEAMRPVKTPQRTPQQEDVIMQEARNLRALREMTPLTATEVPELYEGTGFQGVQPRKSSLNTPNVLASVVQGTPLVPGTPGTTFSDLNTPGSVLNGGLSRNSSTNSLFLRDQFGLNNNGINQDSSDNFSVSDVSTVFSRTEKNRSKFQQQALLSQLSSLPEPEYTYEVAIPQIPMEEDEDDDRKRYNGPEDRAEIEKRKQLKLEEIKQRELERRSQTLKKGLPRPVNISDSAFAVTSTEQNFLQEKHSATSSSSSSSSSNSLEMDLLTRNLIYEEMHNMILYEEMKYPSDLQGMNGSNKKMKLTHLFRPADQIDYAIIPREELINAEELVLKEIYDSAPHVANPNEIDMIAFTEQWNKAHENIYFVPSSSSNKNDTEGSASTLGTWKKTTDQQEIFLSKQMNYHTLQNKYEKNQKKIMKLENKFQILSQGYKKKLQTNITNLHSLMEEYNSIYNNQKELEKISNTELLIAEKRYQTLKKETQEFQEMEKIHQQNYENLYLYAKSCGIIQ